VLTCLSKARLLLEPKKCKFYKEEVKFLGYIVGIYRVQISKEKIKVVKEWLEPKNVKDIQLFIGFINFN
jgi:hypothetical protein